MKRFFIFIKLIFVAPTMFFTRFHTKKLEFDGKFHITRVWANFLIRNAAVKIEVKNTNLIPLEDGYTFISNHDSKYDGIFMIAGNPLDFSFFVNAKTRLPYMTAFLKHIDSVFFTNETLEDDLIKMSQGLLHSHNFHLFLNDLKGSDAPATLLDAAYLTKTAIIPVAIKNARSMMKFGHHKITVSFCTPLHFEEYGTLDPIKTLSEIRKRIDIELKEG